MTERLLCMENVSRSYFRGRNSVAAVVSATCAVAPGDRIALVGPSGSGKSTLLHIMGGLDKHSSGSISWPALDIRESLRPQKIGFVFQMQSLLAPLTVVENVEIPLLLSNTDAGEARAASFEVLDRIGLKGIADKLPEELSGGQAQRVAVARALVCRPRLILADEPTGQLDHPTARNLFDVLLTYLEGSDTALVVSTHDQAVSQYMSTTWRMDHGILEVIA